VQYAAMPGAPQASGQATKRSPSPNTRLQLRIDLSQRDLP
jgi:hypothetical protein